MAAKLAPLLALSCLLFGGTQRLAAAPEDFRPLEITDEGEIYRHRIEPEPRVLTPWADITQDSDRLNWDFELTIDKQGVVTSTILKSGPEELREAADRVARKVRFKPFEQNGEAVPVRLSYSISSQPADYEGPADRRFPANPAPSKTIIALERTECFGACPSYRVELHGNGEVEYRGDRFVLAKGPHHWRVDPKSVARLLDRFRRAEYFRLQGFYEYPVTDLPTYVTSLRVGRQSKYVLDYGGSGMGEALATTALKGSVPHMPANVTEIENAIDKVAGTASWVSGDGTTLNRLRAENWNFQSNEAGLALGLLIDGCKTSLAREFVAAGAPLETVSDGMGPAPSFLGAAHCGDLKLVSLIISRGALDDTHSAREFLGAAADSGNPDMVAIALKHYHEANIKDFEGTPLIIRAAATVEQTIHPRRAKFDPSKVIALLIAAGADPNARDNDGKTPLFEASDANTTRALLNAGADPNARNNKGQTPLFDAYFEDSKQVIIKSGADVNARDKFGATPLFYQSEVGMIRNLIRAAADINANDSKGDSALESMAWERGALALLDAGARSPSDPDRLRQIIQKASDRRWTKVLPRLERAAESRKR